MIVTLTTDFGVSDGYVAAVRGAMLCRLPSIQMVDITHNVSAQDVMEGAFVLMQAAPFFPADTVHLVVVDPGVGTERLPIAAEFELDGKRQFYVGPDNGLLSLLLSGDSPQSAVVLDRREMWRVEKPSSTFHGRDIFGPVAAELCDGTPLFELGSPLENIWRLLWPLPRIDDEGIYGMVLHIDAYGNCLTNIPKSDFEERGGTRAAKCFVGSGMLKGVHSTYGSVPDGEPVLLFASNDHLELAVNGGNASRLLSVSRGDSVNIVFGGEASVSTPSSVASASYA